MPPIQLSDAQLNSLAAFLLKLNDEQRHGARQRAGFRRRRARWCTRRTTAARATW